MDDRPPTERQLNRATLQRQMLLRRERVPVVDAVRRVVALQAQHPASPYLALWNRLAGFDPAELTAAFADHEVVKASLVRMTLHAVVAADYPRFHTAMAGMLRTNRLTDARFTEVGLTRADADAALGTVLELLADTPRNNAQVEAGLAHPRLWWALRTYAPLTHAPTGGPWSFGPRPYYRTARHRPDPGAAREPALEHLVLRYLDGFGPATVADIAGFTRLARALVRTALADLGGAVTEIADGLYDAAGAPPLPPERTAAPPRLLPMWDSVLLAYADRSRILPEQYRKAVIRANGDVLPTLLVDGYVAGVWRPAPGGSGIEATAFHDLPDRAWQGLRSEARALTAFLADREPTVYQRYARWWDTLPGAAVRVLR